MINISKIIKIVIESRQSRWHEASAESIKALWQISKNRYDMTKIGIFQDVQLTMQDIDQLMRGLPDLKGCFQIWDTGGHTLFSIDEKGADLIRVIDDAIEDEKVSQVDWRTLEIDIETYCDRKLPECGVYRYAEDPSFEIILFAYSVNGGRVRIIDISSGEKVPEKVQKALIDPNVLKLAHNAAFERVCLSRWLGFKPGTFLDPRQWDCTMVRAARLGLPMGLDQCGEVLRIGRQKMKEGKALITYFSMPCRPTKVNGMRTRNLPEDAPEKWDTFKRYCIRDVEAELDIARKVMNKPVTARDRELWVLDQEINDRGVLVDIDMAKACQALDSEAKEQLMEEAREITGMQNPNSVQQLKAFIWQQENIEIKSLNKTELPGILARCKSDKSRRLLQIRQELGKTSNNKYSTMLQCACSDGRIRGILQFYGASRTGRWAGRLVQMQNLPQNHIPDLDYARGLAKAGDLEDLELNYENPTHILSELIRTAFIAKPGHVFHVCDFSAIECRVLAWLANEQWVLDTFREGGDIYCATASKMFGVPVEKHGVNGHMRQKGKIATLALGYEGGVGALDAMGGERMGLNKDEEAEIVKTWRAANPHIVKFWRTVENAAKYCIENETKAEVQRIHLRFEYKWGGLRVTLPSGRYIFYPRMHLGTEHRGDIIRDNALMYEGQNQTTKKWEVVPTYGGKMTENITQAIARDILAEVMLRMNEAGMKIVFHVHDEAITEAPPEITLKMIEKIFAEEISWAKGLPLKGAGYTTPYYMKD